jgi:hypothetical protein
VALALGFPENLEALGSIDSVVLDGVAPIPAPMSLLLFGTGLTALGYRARRRRRS